jgi:hypothetical protein
MKAFHLTDNTDLNKIYQAARLVTIQPDTHNVEKLARVIWEAEHRESRSERRCAWCGLVLSQGSLPASHGICMSCKTLMVEEAK